MTSKKRKKPGRGRHGAYPPERLSEEAASASDRSCYRRQDHKMDPLMGIRKRAEQILAFQMMSNLLPHKDYKITGYCVAGFWYEEKGVTKSLFHKWTDSNQDQDGCTC